MSSNRRFEDEFFAGIPEDSTELSSLTKPQTTVRRDAPIQPHRWWQSDTPNEPFPADTWKAINETPARPNTEEKKAKKRLTVLEIGAKLQVVKRDSDTWAVCLLVLFEGDQDPSFAKIHRKEIYAYRNYLSREEARYSRDVIRSTMARNPDQEMFLGVEGEDKQVVSFRPSDFTVQFSIPKSLKTFAKKEKQRESKKARRLILSMR